MNMKARNAAALVLALMGAASMVAARGAARAGAPARPQGPCDIYAGAGDPCVAAPSTTRGGGFSSFTARHAVSGLHRGRRGATVLVLRVTQAGIF